MMDSFHFIFEANLSNTRHVSLIYCQVSNKSLPRPITTTNGQDLCEQKDARERSAEKRERERERGTGNKSDHTDVIA